MAEFYGRDAQLYQNAKTTNGKASVRVQRDLVVFADTYTFAGTETTSDTIRFSDLEIPAGVIIVPGLSYFETRGANIAATAFACDFGVEGVDADGILDGVSLNSTGRVIPTGEPEFEVTTPGQLILTPTTITGSISTSAILDVYIVGRTAS